VESVLVVITVTGFDVVVVTEGGGDGDSDDEGRGFEVSSDCGGRVSVDDDDPEDPEESEPEGAVGNIVDSISRFAVEGEGESVNMRRCNETGQEPVHWNCEAIEVLTVTPSQCPQSMEHDPDPQ